MWKNHVKSSFFTCILYTIGNMMEMWKAKVLFIKIKKKNYFAVKAFHLKWAELPLEANVSKWAVTVLNLDRMRRHLDRATLNMFWEVLDKYVFTRRHYCISFTALSMLHHSTCTHLFEIDTKIFTLGLYFLICLHWKSVMFIV